MSWIDDSNLHSLKKRSLKVVVISTCWTIWRIRNSVVFVENPLKKNYIFGSIVLSSFSWLHNRASKLDVVLNACF